METKKLLILLSIAMLSILTVRGQKIESALVDGHPVINCEGMLSAMYSTIPKGNTLEALKTEEANKTLFKRFAVSKIDNGSSKWSDAFTVCSALGDRWRLPTQRELLLMWVLRSNLNQIEGFVMFTTTNHISSTENIVFDDDLLGYYCCGAFFINDIGSLNDVVTNLFSQFNSYSVRCIRELP